jgi:peptide/nickel transport system permease protein
MLNYLIRRIMIGSLTLLLITFLIYVLIRNMPGDPASVAFNDMDPSQKQDFRAKERMRAYYHLDKPIPVGYRYWLTSVLQGDLGRSLLQKVSVVEAIRQRLFPTLFLSVTSMIIAYGVAMPFGLYASARSGRADERGVSVALYMLYSFPTFVAALLLQQYFYSYLKILPLDQMTSPNYDSLGSFDKFLDLAKHAILPVICYTYGGLAYYSRFIRANMAEVMQQDYIRTARAKGVGPRQVLIKHGFRNTLIPMATLLGVTLPGLLSGSVVLEQIFSWNGMGKLFLDGILQRDYPIIMGLALFFSLLTLLGTLLSDILYALVDPRVTLQ